LSKIRETKIQLLYEKLAKTVKYEKTKKQADQTNCKLFEELPRTRVVTWSKGTRSLEGDPVSEEPPPTDKPGNGI
jgi:hypothetical protein